MNGARATLALGLAACLCAQVLSLRIPRNGGSLNTGRRRPNIIQFVAADQDAVMGGDWHMPALRTHLAKSGSNFTQYIANFAASCPSRTTILAGQCAHNTRVVGTGVPDALGRRLHQVGMETKTGPYLLQKAGYRTGLIGKYLEGWGSSSAADTPPPGWDWWFAFLEADYYNWTASDQGESVRYGVEEGDYSTDFLTTKALQFLGDAKQDDRPFFLYLAPYACQAPHLPAKRHIGKLKGLQVPRVPSWNESAESTAKKATFVRDLPPISEETAASYDHRYQARAETLLAVDDMIEAVIKKLEEIGELDNTYILYTSDNGYKLGHHRLSGKYSPFETDVRLPLYVRGPGIPKGVAYDHLVGNIDILPTWLDLAGVQEPLAEGRDGISFGPILRGEPALVENPDLHRMGMLIEKMVPSGISDRQVSIMTPNGDPSSDPFEGFRPQRLANGSWPWEVILAEFSGSWGFNEQVDEQVMRGLSLAEDGEDWLKETLAQMPVTGLRQYIELAKSQGLTDEGIIRASEDLFPTAYYALRTAGKKGSWKYIEYPNGQFELYDLSKNPHETDNIFYEAPRELIAALSRTLNLLKTCRGAACTVKSFGVNIWE